jgi:SAM-dependent methyltransferase
MCRLGTREDYEQFLLARHRAAHARRTAERWAAFLLPHLRPDMRLLDIGCGPGSNTVGLGVTDAIGVDRQPVAIDGVPVCRADGVALPFPDASFDAVFSNATLQHVGDPLAVLREARRVAKPGGVIGVGDADWDGVLQHPRDPHIDRGHEIREALRVGGDVRVGRQLRGLLQAAGFERCELTVTGNALGTDDTVFWTAESEATWFEAPAVVAHVTELGLSEQNELAAIAGAWRRWGSTPGAVSATFWFTALGWAPD